jgi:hypothetical protein
MSLQSDKLKLIEWLAGINDEAIIEKISLLKNNPKISSDWWNLISEAKKKSIMRGLRDIERGKTISHKEVRKKYEKWL